MCYCCKIFVRADGWRLEELHLSSFSDVMYVKYWGVGVNLLAGQSKAEQRAIGWSCARGCGSRAALRAKVEVN
jgi:hypothetical protein